jgi:hypothetical protein
MSNNQNNRLQWVMAFCFLAVGTGIGHFTAAWPYVFPIVTWSCVLAQFITMKIYPRRLD